MSRWSAVYEKDWKRNTGSLESKISGRLSVTQREDIYHVKIGFKTIGALTESGFEAGNGVFG